MIEGVLAFIGLLAVIYFGYTYRVEIKAAWERFVSKDKTNSGGP